MSGDNEHYKVVSNHEDQHSIWFVDRPLHACWTEVGLTGTKDECLAHIVEVRTDLTPCSVRERCGSDTI